MEVKVTGRHIEVTPALREYAEEKLLKLGKHIKRPAKASFILSVEKNRHLAELIVNLDGQELLAKDETHEMYQAIDRVVETIEKRLRKQKEKRVKINRDKRNDKKFPEMESSDQVADTMGQAGDEL